MLRLTTPVLRAAATIPRSGGSASLITKKMSKAVSDKETPVPSFVYDVMSSNVTLRNLTLDQRMKVLLSEWKKLSQDQKDVYLREPLRGLL